MKKRRFDLEYENYHSKPEAKRKRAQRNKARRILEREGKVSKGDGKDVAHKDNNTANSSRSNLSVQPKSKNRSFPRTKTARRKK